MYNTRKANENVSYAISNGMKGSHMSCDLARIEQNYVDKFNRKAMRELDSLETR